MGLKRASPWKTGLDGLDALDALDAFPRYMGTTTKLENRSRQWES